MSILNNVKYIISIAVSFIIPFNVMAQGAIGSSGLENPIGPDSLAEVVAAVLSVVSTIGAVLVVLAIIYAGFLFVTAQGNSDKIQEAKTIFLWTVVGAIVLLGAKALSEIIVETARGLGVTV